MKSKPEADLTARESSPTLSKNYVNQKGKTIEKQGKSGDLLPGYRPYLRGEWGISQSRKGEINADKMHILWRTFEDSTRGQRLSYLPKRNNG